MTLPQVTTSMTMNNHMYIRITDITVQCTGDAGPTDLQDKHPYRTSISSSNGKRKDGSCVLNAALYKISIMQLLFVMPNTCIHSYLKITGSSLLPCSPASVFQLQWRKADP